MKALPHIIDWVEGSPSPARVPGSLNVIDVCRLSVVTAMQSKVTPSR